MVSVAFFYWKPAGELIQILAAIPLVGSLVGALFQLMREQVAHERKLLLQESQNRFSLGISSHIANVAFDKHVQFSEEYAQEAHKALLTLFQKGPTKEVLQHTATLYKIQQKYAVWLTAELEKELSTFESALKSIGANASYVYDSPGGQDRQEKLNSMYKTFVEVLGTTIVGGDEWQGNKITDELAVAGLIRRLRAVLGIEELTVLRKKIIAKAKLEI
jgi:hypothetical protein